MQVLDDILHFEYAIWILAFALYLISAVTLVYPGEILLCPQPRDRPAYWLSEVPFLWRGKELHFAKLLSPGAPVFRFRYGPDLAGGAGGVEKLGEAVPRALRTAANCSFITLFVAGPLLTWWSGLGYAVLAAGVAAYAIAFAIAVVIVIKHRDHFGSRWSLLAFVFETAICPPYTASIVKRWTTRTVQFGDGLVAAVTLHEAANRWEQWVATPENFSYDLAALFVITRARLAETCDSPRLDKYFQELEELATQLRDQA